MKRLFMLVALCSLAFAVQAKTKYICAVNMPDTSYTTEFETLEECRQYCDVCEETEAETVIPSDLD